MDTGGGGYGAVAPPPARGFSTTLVQKAVLVCSSSTELDIADMLANLEAAIADISYLEDSPESAM